MIAGFGGDLISHAYAGMLLSDIDRDAVARFERGFVKWWRTVARALGPASSPRAVLDAATLPLLELLGFARPSVTPAEFGFVAATGATVVIALPWDASPSVAWREAVRTTAAAQATWALICNGRSLRIVDGSRPWSRSCIHFDLEQIASTSKGVALLWLLAQRDVVNRDGPASLRARIEASDRHAAGVCRALGDGVLSSLPTLAQALMSGRDHGAAFDQALTLIYRMLFLLFAEARGLVPAWHPVYRDAYTIDALTQRAMRGAAPGLWRSLQAISRLAHAGCHAGDLTVTAFNGRLFSPRLAPLVERRQVNDEIIRSALLSLATEPGLAGRRRISYHDLGVEQLGSVYERILEHQPARRGPTLILERTSTQRKSTGSFYTPQSLTDFLVRRTLAPLVDGKSADGILALRVLDPAMGSGAFLVAACRYLAECCEHARVREGAWPSRDVDERDRAVLRRLVAERCLYGVDLNPTAVQLARLSLWLTTLAADRPLTFLDHHLASGNSLIGARLTDLTRPPRRSSLPARSLPLLDDAIADDVAMHVLPARMRLAMEPSDSLEAVRNKERVFAALAAPGGLIARWRAAADAWCGAALSAGPQPPPGLVHEWIAAATGGATLLPAKHLHESAERARHAAALHGVLHWELTFPEVFFDEGGRPTSDAGFDAVIGNPPWDVLRADIGSSGERQASRQVTAAALRFYRTSRIYTHQQSGHANRYQLFVERALQLTRPGGRIGLLLPSGIATDHGSAALRKHLLDRTSIDTWLGFDNRHRIFPIHRSMRFVAMTTTNAGATERLAIQCGVTSTSSLHAIDRGTPLSISRARLAAWDPDHRTVPEVSSAEALSVMTRIADMIPALGDDRGWHARFGRELNATDDRAHFRRLGSPALLPVIEGKHLAPFQVDTTRTTLGISRKAAATLLDAAATFERARIGYRDVASATNKWTLIAAMLPAGTVSTHTVFCLKTALDAQSQWCLLALMNSLAANFLVRLRVTTHVTAATMARLPVPRPAATSPEFARLARLARQLSQHGLAEVSNDYAELNAIAARLYGINRDQYAFILDTFPLISQPQRELCLHVYQATETRRHGGH